MLDSNIGTIGYFQRWQKDYTTKIQFQNKALQNEVFYSM